MTALTQGNERKEWKCQFPRKGNDQLLFPVGFEILILCGFVRGGFPWRERAEVARPKGGLSLYRKTTLSE